MGNAVNAQSNSAACSSDFAALHVHVQSSTGEATATVSARVPHVGIEGGGKNAARVDTCSQGPLSFGTC